MITFDQSLPHIVEIVAAYWGSEAVLKNLFLRDPLGRLTLVVLDIESSGSERNELSEALNSALGGYADPSGINVATPEELFDESLRESGIGLAIPVSVANFQGLVRIVDRRVVGADWLRRPNSSRATTPRLFFVSLKGGVGRSTALCVLAAHLAVTGRRVLAIDMDLEAPGLGTMLLDEETLPRLGLLDYLVESNISEIGDDFLADMLGSSKLSGGRGTITVVPALGLSSSESPLNVLGKLARAYLASDFDPLLDSFTGKVERVIERLTNSGDYDILLIDARAGLHESTAAAAVALQGNTLIFGMDQPQTYAGYRSLLAQQAFTLGPDWSARIHLVEARVGPEGPSGDFVSNMMEIVPEISSTQLKSTIELEQLKDTFDVDWSDNELLSEDVEEEFVSTFIFESELFSKFDPLKNPDRLNSGVYAAVYGDFIATCEEIIQSTDVAEERSHLADN